MWGEDKQLSPRVPPSLPGRPQAGALRRKSLGFPLIPHRSFQGRVPGPQKGEDPGSKTMTFARDRPPPCGGRKRLCPEGAFLGALGGWMPTLEPRLTQEPGLGWSLVPLRGDPSGSICSTQKGLPASCRAAAFLGPAGALPSFQLVVTRSHQPRIPRRLTMETLLL